MIAAFAALLLQVAAPGVPPAPATASPASVLAPGMELDLVTTEPLDSQTARQGQRFGLELAEDLIQSGSTILPKGTRVIGEIEGVRQKQMFGQSGSLSLRPLFVEIHGKRVNLDGVHRARGASGKAAAIPTVIIAGAWGLIITGRSARVPPGTRLTARVR
jgi:hypothetical protein